MTRAYRRSSIPRPEHPKDEIEDQTATVLDVSLDAHPLPQIATLVTQSGWTFVDGIVRAPTRP